MTRRMQRRIVLSAFLFLLLAFAGIRPSAAQSGLPYWTEIAQGGAVPDALWDFDLHTGTWTRVDTAMTGPAPAPRLGQFYFSRKTATAYELYIFGGATAEFAPVLLNDMWRLTIPLAGGG